MMRHFLLISILMQPLMLWGAQNVRLAADEWPPFTGQEGQHHIAQDLVAHALDRAGLRLTVSIGPWKRALSAVQDSRVDGLVAVWRTERRATLLLFSRPVLENRIHAVTSRQRQIKIASLADLRRRVVCKTSAYAYGDAIDTAAVKGVVESPTDRQGLDGLLAGDCEVLLIDELSLRYLLEDRPASQQEQVQVQARLASRQLRFAMSRQHAQAIDIVRAFDTAIGEMMADGTYNRILDLPWLVVSDGSDGHTLVPGPGASALDEPSSQDVYPVVGEESPALDSKRRVYLVNGRQYESWGDAKQAIIDDAQTDRADPLVQETRYEIGVPF